MNILFEIFLTSSGLKVITERKHIPYLKLSMELREPFQAELIADKVAMDSLQNDFGLTDADEIEEQFVSCRYGAFNNRADLLNGKVISDAPFCTKTLTCPAFGKVCKIPAGLSRYEFFVTCKIAEGLLNKEIADILHNTISTVQVHQARAMKKLKLNSRIELALWAKNEGIV